MGRPKGKETQVRAHFHLARSPGWRLIRKEVGALIKSARHARGMKAIELARLIGMNDKTVSAWETGRSVPSMQSMALLANALRLDVILLLPESFRRPFAAAGPVSDAMCKHAELLGLESSTSGHASDSPQRVPVESAPPLATAVRHVIPALERTGGEARVKINQNLPSPTWGTCPPMPRGTG